MAAMNHCSSSVWDKTIILRIQDLDFVSTVLLLLIKRRSSSATVLNCCWWFEQSTTCICSVSLNSLTCCLQCPHVMRWQKMNEIGFNFYKRCLLCVWATFRSSFSISSHLSTLVAIFVFSRVQIKSCWEHQSDLSIIITTVNIIITCCSCCWCVMLHFKMMWTEMDPGPGQ